MRTSLFFFFVVGFAGVSNSQSAAFWQAGSLTAAAREGRHIVPERAKGFQLDTASMRGFLLQAERGTILGLASASSTVELPLPSGEFITCLFLETPLMHPELGERYPYIRTYSGVDVRDSRVRVKFDQTTAGFHAMITGLPEGDVFIDPVSLGNSIQHQVYWKSDLHPTQTESALTCTYDEVNDVPQEMAQSAQWIDQSGASRVGDCHFRTYRLALACTGEYANFFGATGSNKTPAIAAMVTTMNRVNGIYERDAALTMVLVANNDQLVFTNATTDGYTNSDGGTMLGQNQTKCDALIGSSNYDIGHVFSTGGGGVAYLNSPCTGSKAGGVTGRSAPVGDPFDIDYVAHEMGHQYGGNHTQNNNCNRAGQAAVEVGSGITIMGYAGVCAPDVANNSIAMLGGYSLQEIHANITEGNSSGCPQTVAMINAPPTVNAGPDRTIPRNTPFVLSAIASDPNSGNVLSYSWEQMDFQTSTQPPVASSNRGPNFRPWLPSSDPKRWFPKLSTVLSGNSPSPNWEVLADVSRTYKFRITVRDNAAEGGCNAQDDVTLTVDGNSGPFVVTQPNTAVTWTSGSTRTITWDVAGTSSNPVNCSMVDVLLSIDGGLTWPYSLASATANDGSASINLPVVATTQARVMVRANGNVFYDVNDQDFTITTPEQVLVAARAWLEGPFTGSLMYDSLRSNGLIPTAEPYTALGFIQVATGGGEICSPAVLATTGANAIVDWVRLELRSANSASTIVATRQALLQRDGDIVDVDGNSPVVFNVPVGSYYVAVRHRNHLGCMSFGTISLTGAATAVNFTSSSTSVYGSDARQVAGNERLLWMGNARVDRKLSYTGSQNDRDPIILRLGGEPLGMVQGYFSEDCNMDGTVRYTGAANDRDPILLNIGGVMPTNSRQEQLP